MVKMISKKKFFFQKNSSFLKISGTDHQNFLQGLITNDIYLLKDDLCLYSGLLTPQGKFLFDFFIFNKNKELFLECKATDINHLLSKLNIYKLRSDVLIERNFELQSFLISRCDEKEIKNNFKSQNLKIFNDPRSDFFSLKMFSSLEDFTSIKKKLNLSSLTYDQYNSSRLKNTIPQSPDDFIPNKSFLLEMRFDELNGVSWDKGCYMGQELTARTKYRGRLKKMLYGFEILKNQIKEKEIFFNGNHVGEINSFDKNFGLAIIKKDEAENCISMNLHMYVGDCIIKPFIPKWAKKKLP
tara:strand:- start:526 stop:1419 length:894 start_codon:yes stop_codon:yes gene_type:complete